jgi:hypothetical protein
MVGRVLVERIGESVRHVMTDFPGKTEFRKLCQLVVLRENISSNTHSSAAAAVRIVNPRAFTTSFTGSHRSCLHWEMQSAHQFPITTFAGKFRKEWIAGYERTWQVGRISFFQTTQRLLGVSEAECD